MICEIEIPDDWPPGLGLAVAAMIRRSVKQGFPVVVPVRSDTTADQLDAAFSAVSTAIREAGLAV
jgi:3-hydroxyisobutyrate dehydrogenase-like beta-hydroxyacid dehydrogenase